MQRLFSGFAYGWPGIGLLLLRLLTGVALIHFGIANLREGPALPTAVLQIIGIGTGILLLVGLLTPVAGALAATVKVSIAFSGYFSHSGDPWTAIGQAVLGAVLTMAGPGTWSIDARLFGRKRIDMPDPLEVLFSPPKLGNNLLAVPNYGRLKKAKGPPK